LPKKAKTNLKGDAIINKKRLDDWVDCLGAVMVEVVMDHTQSDPLTAKNLIVLPDEISAVVEGKDDDDDDDD
jgi:hypothetical protein